MKLLLTFVSLIFLTIGLVAKPEKKVRAIVHPDHPKRK